jgi:hypothetical protein
MRCATSAKRNSSLLCATVSKTSAHYIRRNGSFQIEGILESALIASGEVSGSLSSPAPQ